MDRRFGSGFDAEIDETDVDSAGQQDSHGLCAYIRTQLAEREPQFTGPFGRRRTLCADYTASGRSLPCIEQHMHDQVLPLYANTHSSASVTAEQTTLSLHEARSILRNAVRASEHDAVLYVAHNCTSAVHHLVNALNLQQHKPIVLVGPHEHHSNLLPWRECAHQLVSVNEAEDGTVDMCHLEQLLKLHSNGDRQVIGCFSAASNVTGIRADVDGITIMLHTYGALSFWDYAAAAPYAPIEMNPSHSSLAAKDAVYFSGHKFVGGVGAPGVLIAKKNLFKSPTPLKPGGGTVFFVDDSGHSYLREVEYREEGGTPDVVGAVRLGLSMRLKLAVGHDCIHAREQRNIRSFLTRLRASPVRAHLHLLGPAPCDQQRLAIFSFVIFAPDGRLMLHHAFVTILLNDLFGIQTRNGCMCAGPYSQHLLGLSPSLTAEYEALLQEHSMLDRSHLRRVNEYSDYEMLRPGFTRLSLPYFMNDADVAYIADCVLFAAENAWKFLPLYVLNRESGEWHHRDHRVFRDRKWLHNWQFTATGLQQVSGHNKESQTDAACLEHSDALNWANTQLKQLPKLP